MVRCRASGIDAEDEKAEARGAAELMARAGLVRPFLPGMRRVEQVLATIENLPVHTIEEASEGGPILVVAPHPDDETLGCGGLIALACAARLPVEVVLATDGAASHPGSIAFPPQRLATVRLEEMRTALTTLGLGADCLHSLGLRDGTVGRDSAGARRAVERLTEYARKRRVKVICTTWRHDPHSDHQAVFRICKAAAARSSARLLAYPTWGWLLPPDQWIFAPRVRGFRLDVETVLPVKLAAIKAHQTQNGMITDTPNGFVLPEDLLRKTCSRHEAYIQCR
jgi:LmbE family N-acetylglucosaminyl deacetylase